MSDVAEKLRKATHALTPRKPDRWVVGALAALGLFYLAGKALGLGKRRPDRPA